MAQKQYSFDFILNAVLNGGFSATFTKAQQEFVRLGAEIKNLQAIQRDVRAYEKQAQAVQNTEKKLDNLKRQYELVNRQIAETKGSTTALEREKLKLEQRIGNTEAALEKQNQKLGETKERLDAAGVSTDNLAGKDEELKKKIEELTEEQKKAAEGAGEFGSSGAEAIDAVAGAITTAGIAEALKRIAEAYRECVEVSADFEHAMSAVEAIADANNREMNALTEEAKRLGATTIYTAQQTAEGMGYMAMAGWDAQEMLAGMKGMTTLAAAAGEDLAQVSDIVTDNLTAFGLTAADTAHFADVLAAAAANSNTNITIMGETFKNSSSVAGALGYSIEDVAVVVGLMANNMVKGSRAGTALRNIFNGLLGGVTLTAEAFGELEYSAVNSNGSMKGLMETVEDLRYYFGQMTEAERVNNAMAIAGMRGYNGLLAVLKATDEDFQSLYDSVNNCTGAAERMATVKLDNLSGDMILAESAAEALRNTLGEQFNPELRELTQLLTAGTNGLNEFIQDNSSLAKGVIVTTGTFMGLSGAIVAVNGAIKAFQALKALGVFAGLSGGMFAAVGAAAALVGGIVAVVDACRDGGPAVRELTEAAREMDEAIQAAGDTYEETAAANLAAANVAEQYIDRLEELGDVTGASEAEQREYQNTLALLLRTVPELSEHISTATDKYGRQTYTLETSTQALRENTEAWKKNAQAQAYQAYLDSLMEEYNDVMLEAVENEIGRTKAQYELDAATKEYEDTIARMNELMLEANEESERMAREYGVLMDSTGYLTQEYWDLQNSLPTLNDAMWEAQRSVDAHEKAMEKDNEAIAEAEEKMTFAEAAMRELLTAMGVYTEEQAALADGEETVQGAIGQTMLSLEELAGKYTEAYDAAIESFSGQFGLFDEAQADAEATVGAAQKALDSQLAYWRSYAENMETLRGQSAEALGTTQENYDALMSYVKSGTPEAAGLAASMVRAVNNGNTEALANLADTLGEIRESQDEAAQETAEWTVKLNEETAQLIEDMKENLGQLDMSEDAKTAGANTIQAYIDQADAMAPQVRSAYERVAEAARQALGLTVPGAGDGAGGSVGGYAGGTSSAAPGWAWVGEEGPELMRMRGGEQILPSDKSMEVARAYAGGETAGARVEMHFHIASGAAPETVNAWESYANGGGLREAVLEVMADAAAENRRRAYT